MIYARKCLKCGNHFDQDTSKELCPKCRRNKDMVIQEELE